MSCGGHRMKLIMAGTSTVVLFVAAVLWLSPSSLQAAGASSKGVTPVVCGIHPEYSGALFRQSQDGEWRLSIGLKWSCPADQTSVAAATGIVRLWSQQWEYEMPCRVNAVSPGQPLLQNIAVDWEEQNPALEALRVAAPSDVRSAFIPDWVEFAAMPESMQADQQADDASKSGSRYNRRGGGSLR